MVNFSSANLAIVAYVSVRNDGLSPNTNSGVSTTMVATGVYHVILPGDPGQQAPLQEGQEAAQTLCFVTVKNIEGKSATVSDVPGTQLIKQVNTFASNTLNPNSVPFDLLILRTVISPPLNTNG
jgi:hypothetical protein